MAKFETTMKVIWRRRKCTDRSQLWRWLLPGTLLSGAKEPWVLGDLLLVQPSKSCGSSSLCLAAPTKSTLLLVIFGSGPRLSVSVTYTGKTVSGKQDIVNSSAWGHLISNFPSQGFPRTRKHKNVLCTHGDWSSALPCVPGKAGPWSTFLLGTSSSSSSRGVGLPHSPLVWHGSSHWEQWLISYFYDIISMLLRCN